MIELSPEQRRELEKIAGRNGDLPEDLEAACRACRDLAQEPAILELLPDVLQRMGLVGEDRLAKLAYLAVTSRLLSGPVSLAVKGPSAGGKSHAVELVLKFFPEAAYYTLTGMSERALAYSEEPLAHRTLVIFEAVGMEGDFASYLIRSLLSEGRLCYETVEKAKGGGMKARRIEREGPTGLVVTTTKVRLHPENETRLLSVEVTDTAEQTKAVMRSLARDEDPDVDLAPWLALQRTLEARDVWIPFAPQLANLIPPAAVRLRRDFSAVLGLIRAHALLHQATRKTDARGRVIATLADYAATRELVEDLVSSGVEATVREQTRQTVDAVARLLGDEEHQDVSQSQLGRELGLDRSTAKRRADVAIERGYLRDLRRPEEKGKPARLVLGDPLPEDRDILPTIEALGDCCPVAGATEGIDTDRLPEGVEEVPPDEPLPPNVTILDYTGASMEEIVAGEATA